jgi:excinuclease ABC subunit A
VDSRVIRITAARQHNLRNVSVDIPRDKLTVITGLSGSGKSSLAFDTIYAEGRRKYVESLSVHARYFLEQVAKPDVDHIEGLPPTIAIEQSVAFGAVNPRSTVATTTEIYDFLRLLFARCGRPHCPRCGRPIASQTVDQIVDCVLAYPAETRVIILAPLTAGADAEPKAALRRAQREGFVRVRAGGELRELKELIDLLAAGRWPYEPGTQIDAVVDRLVVRPDVRARLADAVELSLTLGEGRMQVARAIESGAGPSAVREWRIESFSRRHACPECGVALLELSPRAFSFNSPYGACETCGGLGTTLEFDPALIVPDPERPLIGGALAPWAGQRGRPGAGQGRALRALCAAFNVRPETPFRALPAELQQVILYGTSAEQAARLGGEFEGVIPNLQRRARAVRADAAGGRTKLSGYQSERLCPACHGARLRPEPLAVRIGPHSIADLTRLSIARAGELFERLELPGESGQIAAPILREVRQRLRFLNEVGLGYLTLDRTSGTLSGGEAQRIRLATQLGSGLAGVCYVLDEPTIGLHQRDNERLLRCIRRLVDAGNTVIVVEHDEDVIRAADYLIDIGPGAGLHGGRILAVGPTGEALANPQSITGKYLRGEFTIPLPDAGPDGRPERRVPRKGEFLELRGARLNNLKGVDARFPLGLLCAVTGVSGAGKSTLISQILVPELRRRLSGNGAAARTPARTLPNGTAGALPAAPAAAHPVVERVVGAGRIDALREIDQTPIGRTPRSNPATYTGVFDEIRRLYAKTKEARLRGYAANRFSFNAQGGRCEACQGQGIKRIEMHFLPDMFVECQECRGTRYNRETLEIRYRGKSIADVLRMRVEEALRFFDSFPRIRQGLQALSDVGLSYIELGQPSNTLSGGEAQRVKLAAELQRPGGVGPIAPLRPGDAAAFRGRGGAHTLYVLDEPTTGLHFADIQTLLAVLNRLVNMGNTVLVVEHNLDVIKCADWVIDMGPEGGEAGGRIVAEGTPEQIAGCPASLTGRYLREKLAPTQDAARADVRPR